MSKVCFIHLLSMEEDRERQRVMLAPSCIAQKVQTVRQVTPTIAIPQENRMGASKLAVRVSPYPCWLGHLRAEPLETSEWTERPCQ